MHLFGTVARHEFVGLGRMMANRTIDAEDLAGPVLARSRLGPDVELDATVVAELIVITLADYLDQTLEVNGWRDHHMVDPLDTPLFPGDGQPKVCLFWMAAACRAVKDFLEVVPPIFDGCTASLTYENEVRERDLYWAVVQNRTELATHKRTPCFPGRTGAAEPRVGEVDALAAQPTSPQPPVPQGEAAEALRHGRDWDKRLSLQARGRLL